MVGDDGMGLRALNHLKRNEVMTSGVARAEELPTGMATVIRDSKGESQIIMALGANMEVSAEQAPDAIFNENNILLVQMEVPLEQTMEVIKNARAKGSQIILNLAPVAEISKEILSQVDYLIVNSIEAYQLGKGLGIDIDKEPQKLASTLAKLGDLTCIVTRGPKGCVAVKKGGETLSLEGMPLGDEAIDTTGAGDCFCGSFAAGFHQKKPFEECLRVATVASGLSCMREGAQDSYPYLSDIEEKLENFPKPAKI